MADPVAAVQGCGHSVGGFPTHKVQLLKREEFAPTGCIQRAGYGERPRGSAGNKHGLALAMGERTGRGKGLILILTAQDLTCMWISCASSVAEQQFHCAGLSEQNEIHSQLNKQLNQWGEGQGGGQPQ